MIKMQLGWIDFSKSERIKVLNVLELLSEKDTLDELGIAPIRDGFSNIFFPGTSTIQTRAKYFFAVPYALKDLELSPETNPVKIFRQLDEREKECGEILLEQDCDEGGIIGKRSLQNGKWVKRTPSEIYWSGLRRYGIFTGGNMSLSEYVRTSCSMKARKATLNKLGNRNDNAEENECDDKNAGYLFSRQFWKLPTYEKIWKDNFSISLTSQEAAFLSEQIAATCKDSMLGFVLKNNIKEFLDCKTFQDLDSIIGLFPENIKDYYFLAIQFSDFIYAIRTVFNVIISDAKNELANVKFERQKQEYTRIAALDIDFIMERLQIFNNPLLSRFLQQAQQLMLAGDIDGLKKCIISREVQLKGTNRAKTTHPGESEDDKWYGGEELDYRFEKAKTIVNDIMSAEDTNDA